MEIWNKKKGNKIKNIDIELRDTKHSRTLKKELWLQQTYLAEELISKE